jgi:hypothetical protein
VKNRAWLALLPLWVFAAPAAAQEPLLLRGRVMTAGAPVAGQPVTLHRVTGTGGQTLSADTTDADGSFELRMDSLSGTGVHFVATRYQDQLYVGDTFRAELPLQYVVRVGPGATPVNLDAAQPAAPPATDSSSDRDGAIVVLLALAGLGAIILLAARQRRPAGRQLLVEIADLDNRNDVTPLPQYEQQRAALLQRLRESA